MVPKLQDKSLFQHSCEVHDPEPLEIGRCQMCYSQKCRINPSNFHLAWNVICNRETVLVSIFLPKKGDYDFGCGFHYYRTIWGYFAINHT